MMPPPPNGNAVYGGGGYPSLVPGSMGSQLPHPVSDNSLSASASGSGGSGMMMNTTSSTGLMQALNAQMAANQAAIDRLTSAVAANAQVDQHGNPIPSSTTLNNDNMAQIGNNNMGQGMPAGIAPGDVINGKKRVSPSLPLHPSQLHSHHGIGGMLSASNNISSMNAVIEENESLLASQLQLQEQLLQGINPSSVGSAATNQGAPQGMLDAALQSSLPQSSGLAAALSGQQQQPQQQAAQPTPSKNKEGEVLTNPHVPSANSGLDNSEGNLIVRRGDIIRVPIKNIHPHPPEPKDKKKEKKTKDKSGAADEVVEYKVVSLLGQGTFAQVFHCIEQKTNKCMAVKIVKNKPAYTRQAAVEIDVFRKLNSKNEGGSSKSDNSDDGDSSAAAGGESNKSVDNSMKSPNTKSSETTSFTSFSSFDSASTSPTGDKAIIRLMCYFMHSSHLCLVFEMLGPNLYELLKKRQFRGLPIGAVKVLVRQATEGIKLLGRRNVVHCDLKPENILMVRNDVEAVIAECKTEGDTKNSSSSDKAPTASPQKDENGVDEEQRIKLIDFGSACFEGQTTHTYIQSRFYRSPEVLIGLPYDSAIDIWSLGCVAAELFLGLPILPGVHEHDQLGRILEMIGPVPDSMLEEGSKSNKFFKKVVSNRSSSISTADPKAQPQPRQSWEFKTRQEYINFLTEEEKRSKGGLAKLEQQQTNRYFKKKRLEDIVMHHGVCNTKKEREQLGLFVHFLKGVLDPDPWKRWTAHQASMHPFLTGSTVYRVKSSVNGNGSRTEGKPYDIHWVPPWDASISKRKLLVIQKTKEKAAQRQAEQRNARRRSSVPDRVPISQSVPEYNTVPANQAPPLSTQGLDIYGSPLKNTPSKLLQSPGRAASITSQMAAMADAMSLERARSQTISASKSSPPKSLFNNGGPMPYPVHPSMLSASLGGVGMSLPQYQQQLLAGQIGPPNLGRSFSESMQANNPQLAAQQQLLNNVAFLQQQQQLQPPPAPTFMGAQSFSGAYGYQDLPAGAHHHPYVESELGYALQRPGVVPSGLNAYMALRRSSTNSSNTSLLSHSSLSNLSSSTPLRPGPNMQFNQMSMSPGGLLLQQLGLQEQMLAANQSNYNPVTNSGIGASLLSQQLEDYSTQPAQQQGGLQQAQQQQLNDLVRRQSFQSDSGMMHPGSYQGGGMIPQQMAYNMQLQSASFDNSQQNAIQPQLRTNASMPAEETRQPVNFGDGRSNNTQG